MLELNIANFNLYESNRLFSLYITRDGFLPFLSFDKKYVYYAANSEKNGMDVDLVRYTISDKSKKVIATKLDRSGFICPSPTEDKILFYGSVLENC